jgi:SAM-dependent methyltransferase
VNSDDHSYYVIGPVTVLSGVRHAGADAFSLDVLDERGGRRHGVLNVAHDDGVVTLRPNPALLASDCREVLVEAARLAVRTVVKTFRDRLGRIDLCVPDGIRAAALPALAADGFVAHDRTDRLVTLRRDFNREPGERAPDMEEVYADPYTVPWNFVPQEYDVLRYLFDECPPGARVLDLGCGYGKNARLLLRQGYRVSGVDVSASAIARAGRLLGDAAELTAGDATALPWPARSFDAVLDIGCLHCLPAPRRPRAVRELARVLRPDGAVYSRMFRPRPAAWVAAQPFMTTDFGLEPASAAAVFADDFTDIRSDSTTQATYLVAKGLKNP